VANLGFIIPLNLSDFLQNGARNNWCGAQTWWTNENISLSGTVSATTARVGDTVVIQVGIQGIVDQNGDTSGAVIQNVQAWVCYPNTVPGRIDQSLVVGSMQNSNPAFQDLTGTSKLVFGSTDTFDYQSTTEGTYQLVSLSPWVPLEGDFLGSDNGHVCIVATCAGLADADLEQTPPTGASVGVFVPGISDLANDIDICNDAHQGQRNIAIVPLAMGQIRRGFPGEFAFLSGGVTRDRGARVQVEVNTVVQEGEVDSGVLKALQSGPWQNLPLKPARTRPKSVRLHKHTREWKGWLARIVSEAEEIIEEVVDAIEHRRRMTLTLPPKGLQPLALHLELDPADEPGSVHVYDITQIDDTGKRGGIRVGVVVVP
jgi:hypothetical protein